MFKIISIILLIVINLNAGGCCCVPAISCAYVTQTMTYATNDNQVDIKNEDNSLGDIWNDSFEENLKEIENLRTESLKMNKNILKLSENIYIKKKEEAFLFNEIINYKKTSIDNQILENKIKLQESNVDVSKFFNNESISMEQ